MPQLDPYLIFGEVFWFSLFFGLGYLVIYRVVAKLHLGLRARWAYLTESSSADVGLRGERRLLVSSLVRPLERTALDLDSLESINVEQAPLLEVPVAQSVFDEGLDTELDRNFILKQASTVLDLEKSN